MTSHIQYVGQGEGGSPSPERQQQGMGDSPPPIAPPHPKCRRKGGLGGVTLQKSAVQLSPGDNAGGPQPPLGHSRWGHPPHTPLFGGGVPTAVILGGGGW